MYPQRGPVGPRGPPGPAGAAGVPGVDGIDVRYFVISTQYICVNPG